MNPEELQKKIADLEDIVVNHMHRGYDRTPVLPSTSIDEKNFTAYENISVNDPVRLAYGTTAFLNRTDVSFVDSFIYGATGTNEKWASKFTVAEDVVITTVVAYLKRVGTPTDNTVISIVANSGGNPTGALQGSVSLATSTISTSVQAVTFTFSSPIPIVAGDYWVVVARDGSRDTSNYAALANDGASATADSKVSSSGVWGNASAQSFVVEDIDGTLGQLKVADSSIMSRAVFIGFAKTSINAGSAGLVKILGVKDGFSSLSTSFRYYLQDDGTIDVTPGTFTKQVGIAVSDTEILIQPDEIA